MSAIPVVKAVNLNRFLGFGEQRNHVLRGVSLSLSSATTYSIVGPSGSGKSTLLYLLGLLDQPDSGEIYLKGEKVTGMDDMRRTSARNRLMGFVFQFHFLLPEFSALENVMIPMWKAGVLTPDECRKRATHLLERVGLGAKAERLATQLSGGEQQRVAVARSLANSPAVLLADEPTGNLDRANASRVFGLLRELSRELGLTVLMVTHENSLARETDVCLPMRDGQFESDGR